MTATGQASSGGGWFSKLIVVVLLAVAIALYLRIVMVDAQRQGAETGQTPRASVRVIDGDPDTAPLSAPTPTSAPRPLPDEQFRLMMRIFAPELAQ
jgi:hypothetical protein